MVLPKTQAIGNMPESLETALDSTISSLTPHPQENDLNAASLNAPHVITLSEASGSSRVSMSSVDSVGLESSPLVTSPEMVTPLGMDGLYIGYARTDDYAYYPNEQFDFGMTIGIWVDVDNSWSGTRYVDIFVYLETPNWDIIDGDSVYKVAISGTGDGDAQYLTMYNGYDYMQYVGTKWHILIIVRDSYTFRSFDQKVYITIGPILKDHFTCEDHSNPYGTKKTDFYDTDDEVCEYTVWDTHNLWITWSVKFKFYSPYGLYGSSDWVNLSPGWSEYWAASWLPIKGTPAANTPGSWRAEVLLEDLLRATDYFTITQTVLPSLDVNLVSPADGSTIETLPIELKARVTSGGSSVQSALVRFYVGGGEVGSANSDSSGYASINHNPSPGTYSWYAKAEKSGYTEDTSPTWSFTYGPPPPEYTVSLSSRTIDGQTNVGSITFDSQAYSLPATVSKTSGTYQVTGNPPAEYSFDLWEYSGSISVSDPASQTTSVTVLGDCTLGAVFSEVLIPDFEISVDPPSATVDQGSSTTATVTVTAINGYSYSVTLSASGQPNGVTVTFDPTSDTPTFTSTVSLQVAYDVPADDYPIIIKGTGSDPESKIHERTFYLTVNEITFLNDPRLDVGQSSYYTEIFGVTVSFNIYGIEPSASSEDYKSAVYQHFGISLSGDVQHESMTMFEIYGIRDLADYFNQQWWASWIFTSDFVSYIYSQHDTDGAARIALVFRHSIVTDWEYWITHLSLTAWDLVKLLNGAYQYSDVTLKNLLQEIANLLAGIPIEFGLYKVFLASPQNTEAILNVSTLVIAEWAQKLSDFLDQADLYTIILKIGVRVMGILWNIKDPVSLTKFIISTAFEIADYLITQYFHDYVPETIANIVHIIASWDDPPEITADTRVFSEDGDLVLGWNLTSGDFIDYSSTGFVLRDNNTQIVFLKKTAPVTVGVVAHGSSLDDIPYTLSIIDDYGNESYVSSGFLTVDQSVNIDLDFIENITQFGNHLIIETTVSTTTPIQGEPLTVDIAVNDTAGPRSDVTVSLLINNVTWIVADNLGSGQYQSIINTGSLVGLVPIAIYAHYPNMTTGYDSIILDVSDVPPDINVLSPQNTTYTTNTVDLIFTISEPTSWIGYSLDGQANITITGNITLTGLAEGPHHIVAYASDTYGNMGFSNKVYFTIDTTPPTTSISLSGTLGLDNWYVSDVTITLTATDDVSGVAITAYGFDGTTWITYTDPFTISTEGITTIYYNSTDNAGNMEDTKSTTVKIDKTNPMTTIDLEGILGNDDWYLSDVTVTLGASDSTSGILQIEYSFDEITWIVYTTPFVIDTEGTTTAYVRLTDNAGNVETGTFDVKIDKTPPDLAKSLSGTLGNNDWYVNDVTVTLSGSDTVSGLASIQYSFDGTTWYVYSTPFVISSEGIATLYHTAYDAAGNEFVLPSQQIKIDKTPPTITGAPTTSPNSYGWYNTDVIVHFTATDTISGVSYVTPDQTLTSEDTDQSITGTATDQAGNTAQYTVTGINIDKTPPTITGAATTPPNTYGWYNTDVTVHFTASDSLSGVDYVTPDQTISTEGSDQSTTGTATDLAGNSATCTVSGINIDKASPTITGAPTDPANSYGWYNVDVVIHFTASDSLSGVDTVTPAQTISSEGADQSITGYATDRAGNTASHTVAGINIDKTPPTITGAPTIPANVYGWYNTDVVVHFEATDSLSGIDSITPDQTLSAEGADQLVAGTATDKAGNTASYTVSGINIDKTPPIITGDPTTLANSYGWYNTDVTVHFDATDALSGIATITPDQTLTSEGAGQSVTGTATDKAGNSASYTVSGINIDKTAPTITGAPTTPANAHGWYNTDVTVHFTATDTLSGVLAVTPDQTITTEGADQAVTGTATDLAGNEASYTVSGINIDKTSPTITIDLAGTLGNEGWYLSDVTVTLGTSDPISGILNIEYSFDSDTWIIYTTPFTIDTEETTTVFVRSTDNAGNVETGTFDVKIDKTPPDLTKSLSGNLGNDDWYVSAVTVTLIGSDDVSGLASVHYSFNGIYWYIYSMPFVIGEEGTTTLYHKAYDDAGNEYVLPPQIIKIDKTDPITTAQISGTVDLNDWYVAPVVVTLTAEDPGESSVPPTGSGTYKTYYILNGGVATEYSDPFVVSEQGSHTVQFWSADIAGNTEVPKITEFKIDTIPPVTTPSQSPDGNNDWWRTSPATVTLSASDATSGAMEIYYQVDSGGYVVVLGASALVTVEGNGIHTVNYFAVDLAGNQESEKTETVKIDTISPTTTVDIGTPRFTSDADLYVTSATSFTLSPLDNPEGSGVATTYYRVTPVGAMPPPFDSGITFQIIGDDGEYIIEYYSTDNAGNEGPVNIETIILDNTPPTTTKTLGSPSYDNFVTSATLICLDALDTGADLEGSYYRINGNSWISYSDCFTLSGPDGTYTIEFYSADNLGNMEFVHSQTHQLDNTAPSSSDALSGTIGDNDWFVSSVTVTLSADDSSGSGVATIYYILDDADTEAYSVSLIVIEDGWHATEFWSVDKLGNTESPHKTDSFKIDTTPPSTSASLNPETPNGRNEWYTVPLEVTLTAYDQTSGVATTYYHINSGPVRPLVIGIPIIIPDDGVYTIYFWSVDNAGNTETANSISFRIDQTTPTTVPTIGDPKYGADPTYVSTTTAFTLEASDAISDVDYTEYKIDSGAWTTYSTPFNVLDFGSHTLYYRSVDIAGNIEDTQSIWIVVNAASISYSGETNGQYSDAVTVNATLIDMATQQSIEGKTIIFTIGSQTVTATTDSLGLATASIVLDQPAGAYSVSAIFSGDMEYSGRSTTQPFTIHRENVELEYTGDTVVPTTAKSINLRATIFDSPDGYLGDLTKIQVTFSIHTGLLGSTPSMIIPNVPVSQTDMLGVGVAIATIDILPENGYLIIVSIDGNDYYEGPTSDATPLTVYEPTGDFVTGGGWIWDPSGSKGNFGFNIKYTRSGKPRGHATYVYRESGWDIIVKSNAWIGLAIDGNHAYFEAKCVVQKYNPATGELVWDEGNYKFRIDVWDNDSDGGIDIYQILVRDKNGVLCHEAGFDPSGELQGGNIVIHDERKKQP